MFLKGYLNDTVHRRQDLPDLLLGERVGSRGEDQYPADQLRIMKLFIQIYYIIICNDIIQ